MKTRIAFFCFIGIVLLIGSVIFAGTMLVRPFNHSVGPAPLSPPLENVKFVSLTGSTIQGWFAHEASGRGGVILLHGVRADRRSMLSRAKFLHANGYSVLLVDLQAHGETDGERITFGYLESNDVQSAVEFLKDRLPGEPIGAIGISLGGAACVLVDNPLSINAMVLEAVYPKIEQAIENRLKMRFGAVGSFLTPLLTLQIEPRLGIDLSKLRPIEHITDVETPIFIIAGDSDRRTTLNESRALYEAAPEPKEIWVVNGAAHVDFHRYAKEAYEEKVLRFLDKHMSRSG